MGNAVEVRPFETAVTMALDAKGGGGWRIYDAADEQVAVILADADRVEEIVRLINASLEQREAVAFNVDLPLTMEFEAGQLVKVGGARPEYLSGQKLIALVRKLAALNLAQEAEIGRYRDEVEGLNAELDRRHQAKVDAGEVERRDLFAAAALMGMNASPALMEAVTGPDAGAGRHLDRLSRCAFLQADAMEAARSTATEEASA